MRIAASCLLLIAVVSAQDVTAVSDEDAMAAVKEATEAMRQAKAVEEKQDGEVSEAELEGAYRDGHRAGIIWCKRLGDPPQVDLDEELLARWREGFIESTSLQCASEARKLEF